MNDTYLQFGSLNLFWTRSNRYTGKFYLQNSCCFNLTTSIYLIAQICLPFTIHLDKLSDIKLYAPQLNIIEKQIIKKFHKDRIAQSNGDFAKAQGWKDKNSQQARFDTIILLADFNNVSVLDIGCGYGEFREKLSENFTGFEYIGIDQQTEFINYAKLHFQNTEKTWFHEADFTNCQLPKADIVVASGVFAYQSSDMGYYFRMIEKFYESAYSILIFNMLDAEKCEPNSLIATHNREKVKMQCETICKNTSLLTDYTVDDFTIKMSKD